MSSLALVLALCVVQDSSLTRLRHRADSLAGEWRRADALAALVDSLERERAGEGRDTIAVGDLRIVANASPLPLRAAALRAWPAIDSLYGIEARRLTKLPYIIHAYDPDTTVPRPVLHVGMEVPWNMSEDALTMLLLSNVPIARADAALEGWLGGSVRPSVRGSLDRTGVYVQLVTAPSQAARDCFLGRVTACAASLDLGDALPLEAWYPSPGERRFLVVTSFADFFNHGANATAFGACRGGGDSACTALLRSLPRAVLPRPLGFDGRVTLVQAALRLGGPEAYRRLLADPAAPIGDRLAAAAGVSRDSLVSRWRAEILAARPRPVVLPAWAVWVALGWALFFGGCGLRSSRWRVA
jgi:hypothetical protein